ITEHQTKNDPARTIPTLKEMSEKAINSLSKNDEGFFLMIEAGQIDWAGHYNDTGTMLHEMLRLNETLNYVLDWAEGRD
ncbi:alkaline phosphatase, partial [Psychrobacter sp. TB55-MNA-CIBAN-0194]